MTAVLNSLILILAGGAALAGIYFLVRAVQSRSVEVSSPYNVGRQKAHHELQINIARAVFSFVVALILWGVSGLSAETVESLPDVTESPAEAATAVTTPSPAATATIQIPPSAIPPSPSNVPANTPTEPATAVPPSPMPTDTPSPEPRTATVTSGVGVWLRSEPSTDSEQLEWLLQGTVLTVLEGTAAAENLAWQQVQTEGGLVGWVAVPFITYNDAP